MRYVQPSTAAIARATALGALASLLFGACGHPGASHEQTASEEQPGSNDRAKPEALSADETGADAGGTDSGDAGDAADAADSDIASYYAELVDNGEEPFVPGCWAVYGDHDTKCERRRSVRGDVCYSRTVIKEYLATQRCQGPGYSGYDGNWIDCDSLCRKLYKVPGQCVAVDDICPPDWLGRKTSAKCACEGSEGYPHHTNTKDKGSDPATAGCHWSWPDPKCDSKQTFVAGDQCRGETILLEWEKDDCHPADDQVEIDCNEWCGPEFFGACVEDKDYCGPKLDSAHCLCTPRA